MGQCEVGQFMKWVDFFSRIHIKRAKGCTSGMVLRSALRSSPEAVLP